MGEVEKPKSDYSFRVEVNCWDDGFYEDMGKFVRKHNFNSFKHFMAYQNTNIATDETMVNSYSRSLEFGTLMTAYAENSKLVFKLKRKCYRWILQGQRVIQCHITLRLKAKLQNAPLEFHRRLM